MILSIKLLSAISASFIGLVWGSLPYIRDIFKGKTRPHAYSWLIWAITQGTATFALYYGDGGWGTLATFLGTLVCLLVFLLSFKYGTKNITVSDTLILSLALLAIFIWWQLDNPFLSVIMVSAIDFFAYFPSFRKTWHDPWSEKLSAWIVFTLAYLLSIMALAQYNFFTLTYLLVITFANLILIFICFSRRRRQKEV